MLTPHEENPPPPPDQNVSNLSGTQGDDGNMRYRIARQLEYNIAARAYRGEQSWRRIAFALAGTLVVALLVILVLGVKNQHDVLVYRDDGRQMHVMSEALSTRTPTQNAVEAQIVHWLRALRDVPGGGDYAAVDRDIHDVLASTQTSSKALEDIQRFYREQNPKVLSNSLSRTVRDVRVNSYTANTYALEWTEDVRMGNRTLRHAYSGRVTIVDPQIPDDPGVGLLNPAGVYVANFDLPWSNP